MKWPSTGCRSLLTPSKEADLISRDQARSGPVNEFVRCGWQAALTSDGSAESQESPNHRFGTLLLDTTALCHEIVGNPFHPIALDPAWRRPTVRN